jgi:hypothetical protein
MVDFLKNTLRFATFEKDGLLVVILGLVDN